MLPSCLLVLVTLYRCKCMILNSLCKWPYRNSPPTGSGPCNVTAKPSSRRLTMCNYNIVACWNGGLCCHYCLLEDVILRKILYISIQRPHFLNGKQEGRCKCSSYICILRLCSHNTSLFKAAMCWQNTCFSGFFVARSSLWHISA